MNDILYVLLRRLRLPLITLIVVYAVSIVGFTLVPGMDDQGNPWRMDLFHAFYFVSFMGSTIGFGEIPYPFTDAQRMWTLVTIYASVIAWLYSIGAILAILQDPGFRHLLQLRSFIARVRALREPFYLVCGCGVTGIAVVRELCEPGESVVWWWISISSGSTNWSWRGCLCRYRLSVPMRRCRTFWITRVCSIATAWGCWR